MGKKTIKSLAQGKYQSNNNGESNKSESIDPNQYLIQNESRSSSIHTIGSEKFEDVVLGQENNAANDKSNSS